MKKLLGISVITVFLCLPAHAVTAAGKDGYIKPRPKNISIPKLEKFIEGYSGKPDIHKMKYMSKYSFVEVFKTPVKGKGRCPQGSRLGIPCAYEYILAFNHYGERYRCPDHEADSTYIPVDLGVLGQFISIEEMDESTIGNFPVHSKKTDHYFGGSMVITVQNYSDVFLKKNRSIQRKTAKYALKPLLDHDRPCYLEWALLEEITAWQQVLDAYYAFVKKPNELSAAHARNILRAKSDTDDAQQRKAFQKIGKKLKPLAKRITPENKESIKLTFELVKRMDASETKDLRLALGSLIRTAPAFFLENFENYSFGMDTDKRKSLIRDLGPQFRTIKKQCAELQARLDAIDKLPDARYRMKKGWPIDVLRNKAQKLCTAEGRITDVQGIPKGSIVTVFSLYPKFSAAGFVISNKPGLILTTLGDIKLDKFGSFLLMIDMPGEVNPVGKIVDRNDDNGVVLMKTSPIEAQALTLGDSSRLKVGDPLKVVTLDKDKHIAILKGKAGERFCLKLPCKGEYEFIETGVWVADKRVLGGPVLNDRNEVVGIVTFLHRPKGTRSMQAIGIPSNIIKREFPQISEDHKK